MIENEYNMDENDLEDFQDFEDFYGLDGGGDEDPEELVFGDAGSGLRKEEDSTDLELEED